MKSTGCYLRYLLPAVLLLGGCATQPQTTDATGNLGQEKRNSPAKIYVEMGMAYMRDGQSAVALQKLNKDKTGHYRRYRVGRDPGSGDHTSRG
ncbi:MAG: hypothetical protein DBP01_19215, partial [gamma proteobacterium symbiont of Ctena orbiculata]